MDLLFTCLHFHVVLCTTRSKQTCGYLLLFVFYSLQKTCSYIFTSYTHAAPSLWVFTSYRIMHVLFKLALHVHSDALDTLTDVTVFTTCCLSSVGKFCWHIWYKQMSKGSSIITTLLCPAVRRSVDLTTVCSCTHIQLNWNDMVWQGGFRLQCK